MFKSNADLRNSALETLKGQWGPAIAAFLIFLLITNAGGVLHKSGNLLGLIIGGPMILGASIYALRLARNQETRLEHIFDGFKHFEVSLVAYLLRTLYVFLWSLLLVVPGIIAALSYSMTFYIISDNPKIKAGDALRESKRMMDGHKERLFWMSLGFFGLAILCVFTAGIGFLWLVPFVFLTMANFYEDIKGETQEENQQEGNFQQEDVTEEEMPIQDF